MVQIDMAFVNALEREKAQKREQERPRLPLEIDNWTLPLCRWIGCRAGLGSKLCLFCGKLL